MAKANIDRRGIGMAMYVAPITNKTQNLDQQARRLARGFAKSCTARFEQGITRQRYYQPVIESRKDSA